MGQHDVFLGLEELRALKKLHLSKKNEIRFKTDVERPNSWVLTKVGKCLIFVHVNFSRYGR